MELHRQESDDIHAKRNRRRPQEQNGTHYRKRASFNNDTDRRRSCSSGRKGSQTSNGYWSTQYQYRQPESVREHVPPAARYRKRLECTDHLGQVTVPFPTSLSFVPSLGFDLQGIQRTYAHKSLSLHQTCTKCLPNSRAHFINKENIGAGLQDLLIVDRSSVRGLLRWIAPGFGWAFQNPFVLPLVTPKKEALSSLRVQSAIEESAKLVMAGVDVSPVKSGVRPKIPDSEVVALKQQQARAKSILNTMSGTISLTLLRMAQYTMMWIFSKLFRHFYVQRSHVEMLKAAQEKGIPIVFLPCHKSHMDYLLFSTALIHLGIKIPHIAAGDNLNIPIFNWLIHCLGGFFIRRRMDSGNGRDNLYRECLHEYIEQLLKANQNMEFYIEGSRSRTGKPSLPKAGLLSFLVEAIREGAVNDILMVPVGISYDRIVERNFVRRELMGGNKVPESFLKALGGIWRMLTSDIGCVRLDFAQPFSLQEYLDTFHISNYSLLDLTHPTSPSLYSPGLAPAHISPDRRIVTALSYHIVYDFSRSTAVMATNIVGFLLLTKHRHGVKLFELFSSYKWVVDSVTSQGRAIGFSGTPSEAVHYGLNYLQHLVIYEDVPVVNGITQETSRILYPRLELPDVFQLQHHVNQVVSIFIKEAIIACSLLVIQEFKELERQDDKQQTTVDDNFTEPLLVSQNELLEYALDITKIFAREFIFAPPCVDLSMTLYEGIESLTNTEVFKTTVPRYMSYGRSDMNRPPKDSWDNDRWEDDEEEFEKDFLLEVNNTPEAREHVSFLQSILAPYIEGYWCVAVQLSMLWEQQQNMEMLHKENSFLHELQLSMIERCQQGTLLHVESCSMDILRNALRSYISMELIVTNPEGLITVINHSDLLDTIDILTACKT